MTALPKSRKLQAGQNRAGAASLTATAEAFLVIFQRRYARQLPLRKCHQSCASMAVSSRLLRRFAKFECRTSFGPWNSSQSSAGGISPRNMS